jgi:predicted nucleotidyltransferase component of viral defense system
MIFLQLPDNDKIDLINQLHEENNLQQVIIEKDVWVTAVLRALFSLPYAENLSFKGGTSLSKCWNLIERFSEDIDIAVNREYLGFGENLSKTQINDKLRRAACSFVREKLQFDIVKTLENQGINEELFSVKVNITPVTTTDPEIIEVEYKSLFTASNYIKRKVILEVSGRSMCEPLETVKLQSIIDEAFPNAVFVEKSFDTQAVVPQRTFIEKICLLHEEFAKPQELIRTERMSRHLYDLVQMMDTEVGDEVLTNKDLYNSVVEHRRVFIGLKGFDYSTLAPQTVKIIPPESVINLWKTDYEIMQGTMIYGKSLPFNELIDKIKQLNERINRIIW